MPDVTFEEIDILSSPVKTWTAGVRMIPAIKINGSTLSSVYLTKERISQFIRLQDQNSPTP